MERLPPAAAKGDCLVQDAQATTGSHASSSEYDPVAKRLAGESLGEITRRLAAQRNAHSQSHVHSNAGTHQDAQHVQHVIQSMQVCGGSTALLLDCQPTLWLHRAVTDPEQASYQLAQRVANA